jgi:hypothetical protein
MLNPSPGENPQRQDPLQRAEEAMKRLEELMLSDDPEVLRKACEELKSLEEAIKETESRKVCVPEALKRYFPLHPDAMKTLIESEPITLTPEAERYCMRVLSDEHADFYDRMRSVLLLSGGTSSSSLSALGDLIQNAAPYSGGAPTRRSGRFFPEATWALGQRGGPEAAKMLADEFLRHYRCYHEDELVKALAACRADGVGERILQARIYNTKRLDRILSAVTGCTDPRVFEMIDEIIDGCDQYNVDQPARALTAMTEEQGKHLYRKFTSGLPNSEALISNIARSLAYSNDSAFIADVKGQVKQKAPGWLRANLQDPYTAQNNAGEIIRTLRVLEQNRHPDTVALLGYALTIRYDSVQSFAARTLAKHTCPASAAFLRKALAIQNGAVQATAIQALGKSPHAPVETTAALIRMLRANRFPEATTEAALALEHRAGAGIEEAFKSALAAQITSNQNLTVIRCAASRIKDMPGVRTPLFQALRSSLDQTVYGGSYEAARACARALGGSFGGAARLDREGVEQELLLEKDLRSLTALRRECAALALAGSQNPRIRHELGKLTSDPNAAISKAARDALA